MSIPPSSESLSLAALLRENARLRAELASVHAAAQAVPHSGNGASNCDQPGEPHTRQDAAGDDDGRFHERLVALHTISLDLADVPTIDELCRLAVERGRRDLGFERIGIILLEEAPNIVRGTFGTDAAGNTRDERDWYGPSSNSGINRILLGGERFILEGHPVNKLDRNGAICPHAIVALWDGKRIVGVLSTDNLITGRPITNAWCELARLYALVIGSHISRHQRLATLRDSETRLRIATQAARLGTFEIDLERQMVQRSPRADEILGKPGQENSPLERTFGAVHPDDIMLAQRALEANLDPAGDGYATVELRLRRPDGSIAWLSFATQTLFDGTPAGRIPRRLIGAVLDTTERKQAEEALRLVNERFRIAEDASNGFIYDLDLATYAEERSENFIHVLGYSPDDVPGGGELWEALIHPDDVQRVHDATLHAVKTGAPGTRYEYRIRHKNGHYLWVLDENSVVRDAAGQARRIVGSIVDITARKTVEERLWHLQAATASLAAAQTLGEVRQVIVGDVLVALGASAGGMRLVTDTGLVLDTFQRSFQRVEADPAHTFVPPDVVPLDVQHPASDAARAGLGVYIHDWDEFTRRYYNWADTARTAAIEASAHLPLKRGDEVFGVLSLIFAAPRAWDEAERAFALTLADRAAIAYERARLSDAEQRAKERAVGLQSLTAKLASALTPSEVVRAVLDDGLPALGATAGSVMRLDGDELEIVDSHGYPDTIIQAWRRYPLSAKSATAEAARTRQAIWVSSPADYQHRYGFLPGHDTWALAQAWAGLPLVVGERVLGALGISYPQPCTFDTDTRRFATTVTDLCAQALDRTGLFEAIRASEARFHDLADAMPQIVWINDATGRISYLNQRWLDYTGLSLAESLRDTNAPVHPEDRPVAEAAWAKNLSDGQPFEYELRLRRHDGAYRWFLVRCEPVQGATGHITGWYGTSTDIHEHKLAELDASFLAELGERITHIADPAKLIAAVTQATAKHFSAARCLISEVDVKHDRIIVRDDYHARELRSLTGEYRLSDFIKVDLADYTAGRTVTRADVQADPRTASRYLAAFAPLGIRAALFVPLLRAGRWVATIGVMEDMPRAWDEREAALLSTVGERMWLALETMRLAAEQQALNETLEARVNERTAELRDSQAQLRLVSTRAERAREEERTRIAREVHDQLGGSLTALKMSLARVRKGREVDTELTNRVQDIRGQADELVQIVRRIASDLRPPILDDFGLAAALEWQAREWEQRTGITCLVELPPDEVKLDRDQRTAVFRVFQESLTNIARHAQAATVTVTLTLDEGQAVLMVRDDGRGISSEALRPGKSLGLMGMRERLREVAGDLTITGSPGHGTIVTICVPLMAS